MTKTVALTALLLMSAGLSSAEDKQCVPPAGSARKIIQLQHLDVYPASELAKGLGLCVAVDRGAHLLALSGPAAAIATLEETLKKYDLPQGSKPVEVTGYILVASSTPAASPATLPPALAPVVAELKNTFPYQDYSVLDTFIVNIAGPDHRRDAAITAMMPGAVPNDGKPKFYDVRFILTEVSSGRATFDNITLQLRGGTDRAEPVIQTAATIRDGQKVVIGKTNGGSGQAYFLVLGIKLLD